MREFFTIGKCFSTKVLSCLFVYIFMLPVSPLRAQTVVVSASPDVGRVYTNLQYEEQNNTTRASLKDLDYGSVWVHNKLPFDMTYFNYSDGDDAQYYINPEKGHATRAANNFSALRMPNKELLVLKVGGNSNYGYSSEMRGMLCVSMPKGYRFTHYKLKIRPISQEEWDSYFTEEEHEKYGTELEQNGNVEVYEQFAYPYQYLSHAYVDEGDYVNSPYYWRTRPYYDNNILIKECENDNNSCLERQDKLGTSMTNKLYFEIDLNSDYCPFVVIEEATFWFTVEPFEITLDYDEYRNQGFASPFDTDKLNLGTIYTQKDSKGRVHYGYYPYKKLRDKGNVEAMKNRTYHAAGLFYNSRDYFKSNGDIDYNQIDYSNGNFWSSTEIINSQKSDQNLNIDYYLSSHCQPYGNMSSLRPGHYFAEAPFWASDVGTEDPLNTNAFEYLCNRNFEEEDPDRRYSVVPTGYRITGATITVAVEKAMDGFYLRCTNNGDEYYLTCYPTTHISTTSYTHYINSYGELYEKTYACAFLLENNITSLGSTKTLWRMDNEGHIFTVTDDNKVMFLTNTKIDSNYKIPTVIRYEEMDEGYIYTYYNEGDRISWHPQDGNYVQVTEWTNGLKSIDKYTISTDSTQITTTYNGAEYYLSCIFDTEHYNYTYSNDVPNALLKTYDATATTENPCRAVHDAFRDVYGYDGEVWFNVYDENGEYVKNSEGEDSILIVSKNYPYPREQYERWGNVNERDTVLSCPPAYKMVNYIDSIRDAYLYKNLMTYSGVQMDIFTRYEKDYTKEYSSEDERLQFPLISLTKTEDMDTMTVNDPYHQARWRQTNGVLQLSIGHGKGFVYETINGSSGYHDLDSIYYLNSDAIHIALRDTATFERCNFNNGDYYDGLYTYYQDPREYDAAWLPYADVKVTLRVEPLNPYVESVNTHNSNNYNYDENNKKDVKGTFLNTKPEAFTAHGYRGLNDFSTYLYHSACVSGNELATGGYAVPYLYSWDTYPSTQTFSSSYYEYIQCIPYNEYRLYGRGMYEFNFLDDIRARADSLQENSYIYTEVLYPTYIKEYLEYFFENGTSVDREALDHESNILYERENHYLCDTLTYIVADRPMYYLRANPSTVHVSYVPYANLIKNYYTPEVKFMRIYDSTYHDGVVDKSPYYGATINNTDADDDGYSFTSITQITNLLDSVINKGDTADYMAGIPKDMKHILYINTDSITTVYGGEYDLNGYPINDGDITELRQKLAPNALIYLSSYNNPTLSYEVYGDTNVINIERGENEAGIWDGYYSATATAGIRFIDKQPAYVPIGFTKPSSSNIDGNTYPMEYVRNFTTPLNGRATYSTLVLPFSVPLGSDNLYDGKLKFYAMKSSDCVVDADPQAGDGTNYYDQDALFSNLTSTSANTPYLVVPQVASTADDETFSIKIEDEVAVSGWQDDETWPREQCHGYPLDEYPYTIGSKAATVEGETSAGTVNGSSVSFAPKGTYSGGVFDRNSNIFYFGNNKMLSSQNIKESLQTLKMYPFRVYYEYTVGNSSGAKLGNMNIIFDESTLPTDITLDDATQQRGGLIITTGKGRINIEATTDMPLSIHDLSGRLVFTDQMTAGDSQTITVHAGVYVVNNQKIIVK